MKKILVILMIFAIIVGMSGISAAENKNDGKDGNPHDGDAGKGNDNRDKYNDNDDSDNDDSDNDNSNDSNDDSGNDEDSDDSEDDSNDDSNDNSDDSSNDGSDNGNNNGNSNNHNSGLRTSIHFPSNGAFTFGTSDCDRVRILLQVDLNEKIRAYKLYNIYWGQQRLDTLEEMIDYCERYPQNFDIDKPISKGYFIGWI